MKTPITILFLLLSFLSFSQSVGINDDGSLPDPGAILDINSSNKGLLIPRIETTAVSSPKEGMLVYQPSDQSFHYYKSGVWEKINSGDSAESSFETTSGNVIRSAGSNIDSEDLIIGRTTTPGFSNITDKFIWYDQSSGAFRGGKLLDSDVWAPINLGANSFAYGENVKADGPNSMALGKDLEVNSSSTGFAIGWRDTVTASLGSGALGTNNIVEGTLGNIAIGENNKILGTASNGALALGQDNTVINVPSAIALGTGLTNFVDSCVVVGRYNSLQGYPFDLAFAVGIGKSRYDSANPRADGMIIRGNGYVGISENLPNDMFQIRNTGRKPNEGLVVTGDTTNEHVHFFLHNRNIGGKDWGLLSTGGDSPHGQGKFIIRDVLDGIERFTINGLGDVGIGTIDPLSKLTIRTKAEINDGISLEGDPITRHLAFRFENNASNAHHYNIFTTGGNATPFGAGKFIIRDVTSQADRLIIDSLGNIGVRRLIPNDDLHLKIINDDPFGGITVEGGTSTQETHLILDAESNGGKSFLIGSTGNGASIGADKFIIRDMNAGEERLVIGSNGNVAVGLDVPVWRLGVKTRAVPNGGFQLLGDPVTENLQTRFENNSANAHHYNLFTTGGSSVYGAGKFILRDITKAKNRMTLDSLGNFGFGVSNPPERLSVNGAIVIDTALVTTPGTIQFKNDEFQGYDGASWVPFGSGTASGSSLSDTDGDTEINLETTPDLDVIRFRLDNTLSFGYGRESGKSARMSFVNNGNNTLITNKTDLLNTNTNNVLIGPNAGLNHSTSQNNVYIGVGAAKNAKSINDIVIGHLAFENSTGTEPGNIVLGANAMQQLGNGLYVPDASTIAIGFKAGQHAKTNGIFIGENAGSNVDGEDIICIGEGAGESLISGTSNTVIGQHAAENVPTNLHNSTIIGAHAGNGVGGSSTAIGTSAGGDGLGTAENSTFLGTFAGRYTSGNNNTYLGGYSGQANTTGEENTFVGHESGLANTSGKQNTFIGQSTGRINTSGKYNTYVGADAGVSQNSGDKNTYVGAFSGKTSSSGNSNTMIGYDTYMPVGQSYTNASAFGAYSSLRGSHEITVGGTGITDIGGYSSWSNLSDGRFKENVKTNVPGLEFINILRPVTYNLKTDAIANHIGTPDKVKNEADFQEGNALKAKEVQTGFIAQEVEQAAAESGFNFSGVLAPSDQNDTYRLRYAEFVVPLVKAVQEQQDQIEAQKEQLQAQQLQINKLMNLLDSKN